MPTRRTTSAAQTRAFGRALGARLRGGDVVALTGELGAGKTVVVKGIAAGLGIVKTITSPTFLLMRVYPIAPRSTAGRRGVRFFVHVDCYRAVSARDVLAVGLGDYLGKPDTVTVVEWPDRIAEVLPRRCLRVTVAVQSKNQSRTLTYASR